jgi:hypothetical protein
MRPPLILPAPEPLPDLFPELVEPLKEVLLECEQNEQRYDEAVACAA